MSGFVKLINRSTGQPELVDVDDLPTALSSQKYEDPGTVPGERFGTEGYLSTQEAEREGQLYKPVDPTDLARQQGGKILEAQHDNIGSTLKAVGGGAISTFDAELWKPWAEDQSYHPIAKTIGSVGALVPAFFLGSGEADVGAEGAGALAKGLGETSDLGDAALKAYSYTPPGIAARIGQAAGRMLPDEIAGSARLGNIAKTAAEGAAWSSSDELTRQALDPDAQFSGEQLLSSMAYGGLIGGVGSGLAEGLGGIAERFGKGSQDALSAEERASALSQYRAKMPDVEPMEDAPWAQSIDLTKSPNQLTAVDAMARASQDFDRLNENATELSKMKGVVAPADAARMRELAESAGYVSQRFEAMPNDPLQALGKMPARIDDAQELADLVRKYSPESVPGRWSEDMQSLRVRGRQAIESQIADAMDRGVPMAQEQADGLRVANELGVGKAPAEVEATKGGLLQGIGKRLLGNGLLGKAVSAGSMGAGAAIVGEHILEHGARSLVGGGLELAALGAGAKLGAKALRAAFSDPMIGGAVAGSTVHVLRSANLLPGDHAAHTDDPRRALHDFAERTRKVTPQAAGGHAVQALSHVAGAAPLSVARAGEVAQMRQQYLLSLLDREAPEPTPVQRVLGGRPLPTAAAAGRVADAMRALASPANVIVAAMAGKLTPAMMQAADAVYPATMAKLRASLLTELSKLDPDKIPISQRRTIEALLGPGALGGRGPGSVYYDAMRASEQRMKAVKPPGPPPQPPGPTAQSPLETAAQKAADPTGLK